MAEAYSETFHGFTMVKALKTLGSPDQKREHRFPRPSGPGPRFGHPTILLL
jgi:hypothetical protein